MDEAEYCTRCGSPDHLQLVKQLGPAVKEVYDEKLRIMVNKPLVGIVEYEMKCWKCGFVNKHFDVPNRDLHKDSNDLSELTIENVGAIQAMAKNVNLSQEQPS